MSVGYELNTLSSSTPTYDFDTFDGGSGGGAAGNGGNDVAGGGGGGNQPHHQQQGGNGGDSNGRLNGWEATTNNDGDGSGGDYVFY